MERRDAGRREHLRCQRGARILSRSAAVQTPGLYVYPRKVDVESLEFSDNHLCETLMGYAKRAGAE